MVEARACLRLVEETATDLLQVGEPFVQDLERDLAIEELVVGFLDCGHAVLTELRQDQEASDFATDH